MSTQFTSTGFWNSNHLNFNATTAEAVAYLSNVEIDDENKDILIVTNFYQVENSNVGKYHDVQEAKANQNKWLANTVTFGQYKEDLDVKISKQTAKTELMASVKVGDSFTVRKWQKYILVKISEILENSKVKATDGEFYNLNLDDGQLCGVWSR